ncbi:hypothetical protein ABTX60_00985 [Streptomyces sp. NPDC126510]|uniref:hypothetical protein n=1 Tax=Streptomyces sp. NPDC126510 TaxID=3155317 RepID=UPI00331FD5BA
MTTAAGPARRAAGVTYDELGNVSGPLPVTGTKALTLSPGAHALHRADGLSSRGAGTWRPTSTRTSAVGPPPPVSPRPDASPASAPSPTRSSPGDAVPLGPWDVKMPPAE